MRKKDNNNRENNISNKRGMIKSPANLNQSRLFQQEKIYTKLDECNVHKP